MMIFDVFINDEWVGMISSHDARSAHGNAMFHLGWARGSRDSMTVVTIHG